MTNFFSRLNRSPAWCRGLQFTSIIFLGIAAGQGALFFLDRGLTLPPGLARLAIHGTPLVFFGLVGALATWALARLCSRRPGGRADAETVRPPAKMAWGPGALTVFQALVCLLIMVKAVRGVEAAMDWDELDAAVRMIEPAAAVHNPNQLYNNLDMIRPQVNTRNHSLANLLARASLRTFGRSQWAARWPSLVCTLFFLGLVWWVTARYSTYFTRCLIFGHLAVNQLFLWYTHSMRGYITMMTATFAGYYLALALARGHFRARNLAAASLLFFVVFCAPVFTHPFGGLFTGLLLTGLLVWLAWHVETLTPARFRFDLSLWLAGAAALPVIGYILISQMLFLIRAGTMHTPTRLDYLDIAASLFGVVHRPAAIALLGFVAALAVGQFARPRAERRDLPTCFLAIAFGVVALMIVTMRSSLFESRFLLGFLVPQLMWMGDFIEKIAAVRTRNLVRGIAVAALTVLPWSSAPALLARETGVMGEYHAFIVEAGRHLPATPFCLAVSGEPDQASFTKGFYFSADDRRIVNADCAARYRFHFARSWQGRLPVETVPGERLEVVYTDGRERFLYRALPSSGGSVLN